MENPTSQASCGKKYEKHEMSKPIFWEKMKNNINLSSVELADSGESQLTCIHAKTKQKKKKQQKKPAKYVCKILL